MPLDTLTHLVETYRYWVLVPLSIIEGPIVAFIAGTLAALGYFNIYALVVFFFLRDMVMDAAYYSLGYFGGNTALAKRILAKLGITEGNVGEMHKLWEEHAGTTMFIGKVSYGISPAFIVAAGMVRMSLVRFFGWGAVVAVAQYGVLLGLGYFFGTAMGGNLGRVVSNAQYVLGGAALVISAYYMLSWYMRRRFLKPKKAVV